MRTVVIGTAGHIDHGKTTLLRALTGIDADRLPEERERGMTIDVGFAHLDLEDGTSLDFVDVPGHDRLVGNMLVGAGEIDAALLVVAADDGPRAQTFEHLELLDALGLTHAVVAITKTDAVDAGRVDAVVAATRALIDRTSFAGAAVVRVSGVSGQGVGELRNALVALRNAVLADLADRPSGPVRLAVDRAFTVRGRGLVVTGTLRGGSVSAGDTLRIAPGGVEARVREVQVHHGPAAEADGGRAALNLATVGPEDVRRGSVLTAGDGIESSDRLLVSIRPSRAMAGSPRQARPGAWPPRASAAVRLHLWTETVDATVRPAGAGWTTVPDGSVAAVLRLADPVAVMAGARAVLRDPGSGQVVGGVTILDTQPPRGVSRRRMTPSRVLVVASGIDGRADAAATALIDLHGAVASMRLDALRGALATPVGHRPIAGSSQGRARQSALVLAPDIGAALSDAAVELAIGRPTLAELRAALLVRLRRLATIERESGSLASAAIDRVVAALIDCGRVARGGDRVVPALAREARGAAADLRRDALDRLEAALDVDLPPSLVEAARAVGAPPDALATLERSGRIVRVDDDLAWSAARYTTLRDRAVAMARAEPLTPAALRDAIGGNRRVALALLDDLGRKGVLRRTDAGHVPGPRA